MWILHHLHTIDNIKNYMIIKMEVLLEKMVVSMDNTARNTETKSSFYILLSEKSSRIRPGFNSLIQLDRNKKYEMVLVNFETYYSFPNIYTSNNNLRYSPDNGVTWFNLEIPEGCYEITNMNKYVKRVMKDAMHYDITNDDYTISLEPNNTLKAVLNIAANYVVDFTTTNSITTVLGFNSRQYTAGYNESENLIDIISISSLRVTSDIIGASYSNGATGNVIYSFFPNVAPGYKIIEVPVNLVGLYLPMTLFTISAMETKLTDQNGKLLNLRGEELSIRFQIREV